MSHSSYIVGTFEKRLTVVTQFQIFNPATRSLQVHAIFLGPDGNVEHCVVRELGPMSLWELDTTDLDLTSTHGIAMFFSLWAGQTSPGIAGLQRRFAAGTDPENVDYAAFAESNLMPMPENVASETYSVVSAMCP